MGLIAKIESSLALLVQRYRWWHTPLLLLIVFLLCCALAWWYQHAELERRYAEMRAAGHPVTLKELDDYYALPEGTEDNTELWLKALRLVKSTQSSVDEMKLPIVGDVEEIPPVGQPWAEKDLVAAYLQDYDEALTAIHKAAAAGGGVRYPHNFQDGWAVDSLIVIEIRSCSRLLSLEANLLAHNGDLQGACRSIRDGFAVGRSLERDPMLVAFLVRVALDYYPLENTANFMNSGRLSAADLRAIQSDLRRSDYSQDLRYGLIGDRTLIMHGYDDLELSLSMDPFEAGFFSLAANSAKTKHFDLLRDSIAAIELPWHEAISRSSRNSSWEPSPISPVDYLVGQGFWSFDGCFLAGARVEAQSRCLDAAISAELYQREYGSLPSDLKELVPSYIATIPIDPFDGKPLRYIIENDAFVIYSVGRDKIDGGGTVEYDDNQHDFPDVGIRIKRATHTEDDS